MSKQIKCIDKFFHKACEKLENQVLRYNLTKILLFLPYTSKQSCHKQGGGSSMFFCNRSWKVCDRREDSCSKIHGEFWWRISSTIICEKTATLWLVIY